MDMRRLAMTKLRTTALTTLMSCGLALITLPSAVHADEVGDVSVDWLGGDIKIEAVDDPKVQGITCHIAYFDRGLIDRLRNGQVFSDPSNSSVSCSQTGPVVIGDIDKSDGGESVFSKRTSLVWKSLKVTRIYDEKNQTMIYLSHATEVQNGSAKMDISTVPLFGQKVTWSE
jgi:CreA protein